jgi:hypothetical protein
MRRILILITALLILSGCIKQGKERKQQGPFTIDLLFEHEGCKVYRFRDNGEYIYYSTCQGTFFNRKTETQYQNTKQ